MPTEATTNQAVITKAINKISEIATLPEITVRIIDIVEDPKSTAHDLHEVIKNDPALSAKILKVVNSAFYGLPGQIANMDRAIVLLGLSAVKNIAIAASISRLFKGDKPHPHFSAKDLWRHSVGVAVAARKLAILSGNRVGSEDLFVGGLMHDLGILIERQAFGDKLLEVIEKCVDSQRDFCSIETEMFGASHPEFGLALATKWKFPKHLLGMIGYHHGPEVLPPAEQKLATLVQIADVICCREEIGFSLTCNTPEVSQEMLSRGEIEPAMIDEMSSTLSDDVAAAETSLM